MTELSNQKTMTTKEVAEALGVDARTIRRVANKLFDPRTTLSRVINGGESMCFTETQVTAIKQSIQHSARSDLKSVNNLKGVSTEVERIQKIQEAWLILQDMANEYKQRAEVAEGVVNRISDSKGLYSVNQAAKALQLGYGNVTFFKKLVEMKVVMNDKNHTPYQECVNDGYLVVKSKYIPAMDKTVPVTLVSNKGLVWLAKKFDTTVDESVEADA